MTNPIHQCLDKQASTRPDARALIDTIGCDWSYADLATHSVALAGELTGHGVCTNDRILVVLENCAAAVAAIFAASRIGATVVPCNARLSTSELERIVNHSSPSAILFTSTVSSPAREHAAAMGATTLQTLKELAGVFPGSSPDPELADVATILYTTGTTGVPKGVMLTHSNLNFGGQVASQTRLVTSADTLYGILPISHVFGLSSIIMTGVISGACIRLEPRFVPAKLYEALTTGVTLLSAVPQMHALLMQYANEQGFDQLPTKTLRYVSSGAAPLDPDWKRRAEEFYGVPLQNGYGMTETTAGASVTRQTECNKDISVGTPFPGVEIRLNHDVSAAQDDVGEIQVSGGGVMKGYFRNDEETARAFTADGWLHTGDLGRYDDAGNLHIAGRTKELIIHGGFNVYPPEVEAALNEHPQVVQCAVIGHQVDGDELVYAFVEATDEDKTSETELQAFAAERLAGYKRPSRIVLCKKLPAAATGKILKHQLKELAFTDKFSQGMYTDQR